MPNPLHQMTRDCDQPATSTGHTSGIESCDSLEEPKVIIHRSHAVARKLFSYNLQGSQIKGTTWQRTVKAELTRLGYTWNQIERTASNRRRWQNIQFSLSSS
jgi:hypothetical protein